MITSSGCLVTDREIFNQRSHDDAKKKEVSHCKNAEWSEGFIKENNSHIGRASASLAPCRVDEKLHQWGRERWQYQQI